MIRSTVVTAMLMAPTVLLAQVGPGSRCLPLHVVSGGIGPVFAGTTARDLRDNDRSALPGAYVSRAGELCQALEEAIPTQVTEERGPVSPSRAFALSAVVPGLGQRYLDQGRWIAYVGIETWAWIQFFDERSEGTNLQADYRDLAWSVARRVSSGPRRDGDFEYYEALTQFTESGAYDAEPQRPGLQPETDPRTFNGTVWELAQDIFFPADSAELVPEESSPYLNALAYYRDRSITPEFTWSWSENELQQSVYKTMIEQSDENLRNSTTMVGVIIANHLVSAVDALVSARLRVQPDKFSATVVPLLDRRRDWGFVVRYTL